MSPAEAAIREALADITAGTLHADFLAQACNPVAIRSLLSELDALRARCEAVEALLREVRGALQFHQEQTRPIHGTTIALGRIDAYFKEAGHG